MTCKIISNFIELVYRTRNSTPSAAEEASTATTTLMATYQLQEFANNLSQCADFCAKENINSTHLTVIGLTCDCYSNLNTFHCEEEEGEPLANVYCIKVNKVELKNPDTEPSFSWREPLDMLPTNFDPHNMESLTEIDLITKAFTDSVNTTPSDEDIETSSTDPVETSVILVTVLLVAAVLLLAVMAGKTCWEIRKQKNNELKTVLQESKESFNSVIIK